jgi:hypothetical protein
LGRATTRSLERVAASVGMLNGAPIEFELVKDVPDGGVLLALPALLLLGLLSKSREMFSMLEGFYPLESIFLLLALMALARIPSLEALRYVAPGEWGKLIGLDRIPEVRTLRQKISQLCSEQGVAERWSSALAKQWMAQEPECAGVFYADGHVRVYHGKLTDLPRRYIARERLCLRGTTDYWVNAMDGRPFFVVSCGRSRNFGPTRSAWSTGSKSAWNWPNAVYDSPMIYGYARSVTSRKKDTKARF